MIVCGWCGHSTDPARCQHCGRNPVEHWEHRDMVPPGAADTTGRPALDAEEIRGQYRAARAAVLAAGKPPTVEAIAEELDRSPRTVRAWRKRFDLE